MICIDIWDNGPLKSDWSNPPVQIIKLQFPGIFSINVDIAAVYGLLRKRYASSDYVFSIYRKMEKSEEIPTSDLDALLE